MEQRAKSELSINELSVCRNIRVISVVVHTIERYYGYEGVQ